MKRITHLFQIILLRLLSRKATIGLATLLLFGSAGGALAQGTMFTYQGRITDQGTNFTGTGQFKFALVTSTNLNHQATATANAPSGGYITAYTVTSGGNGYTSALSVTVSGGGGSGAAATAVISGGAVIAVNVSNPGDGHYTTAPTVTIAPPPADIVYTSYWSNDGTSVNGSQPGAVVDVPVNNGLFNVTLGDTTLANMAAINAGLFMQPNLQLRIWFSDGVNGFAALDPAQNLTPTPYTAFATTASNLSGTLPTAQLSGTIPMGQLSGTAGNFSATNITVLSTIAGNGGGLTNLNASQLASGTLPLAQLPGVVLTNGESAIVLFNNDVNLDNANYGLGYRSSFAGQFFDGPLLWGFNGGALGTVGPNEVSLTWDYLGNVWVSNHLATTSLNVDRAGLNAGSVSSNALTFGISSGEGIASQRSSGVNQYDLEFYTDYTNRMTIANSGNVGINTTTPSETLEINGTSRLDDNDLYLRAGTDRNHGLGYRANLRTDASTNTTLVDGPFLYGYNGGALGVSGPDTAVLQWNYSGNVYVHSNLVVLNAASKPGGGSWSTYSDGRLKDVAGKFTRGLEALAGIDPVQYHYKPDNYLSLPSQPEYVGVLAQEVQQAVPEAVSQRQDGYLTVNNDPIIWTMVNAIKELNQKVDKKTAENAELKAQNKALAERLNELAQAVHALAEKK